MEQCLICGTHVKVTQPAPEIVACSNDLCIHTIENSIGLHYQAHIDLAKTGRDFSVKTTFSNGYISDFEVLKNGNS
jgi:hypothetical protein